MRTLSMMAAMAILVLAIGSDGASKSARQRRANDPIHSNRDSVQGSHQQQLHPLKAAPNPQPRSHAPQHEAGGSRIVFPASTSDYDDHENQIVTGANSLEGLFQGEIIPGLIYVGQAKAAPGVRAVAGQVAPPGSLPQGSNPASRCILCEPGSCPDCYRLDHTGVCRHIYGCEK